MPLDGLMLHAVCAEVSKAIAGGRVDRVNQPEKDEIHILIRSQGQNRLLMMTANASQARLHLTRHSKPNPMQPPMFCMLLRKHLQGSRVLGMRQLEMERIVEITFEAMDDLGDLVERRLMVEIMGRHSNIIFLDESGRIIDSAHRVSADMSRVRQILPGMDYTLPPSQDKVNPLTLDEAGLAALLSRAPGLGLAKHLQTQVMGLAPSTAAQISLICAGDEHAAIPDAETMRFDSIVRRIADFFAEMRAGAFHPTLVLDAEKHPAEIFPFEPRGYDFDHLKSYPSACKALDDFYVLRDRQMRAKQRKSAMVHAVSTHLERCRKKSALQQEQIADCAQMETWRLYGELLTANLHQLQGGLPAARVTNYYDPECGTLEIPMDVQLTPSENAQRYYKKYNKAKTTVEQLTLQIAQTAEEIDYLEGQLDNLDKCDSNEELSEIREELEREGYINASHARSKQKKARVAASQPYHYQTPEGIDILVGKNNLQNDRLTLRTAAPDELWLHVKDAPGSHVIVRQSANQVTPETLQQAALLAAWYSRSRGSGNIAVDYAPRKYVRKPSGAKPGMVIYDHQRTLYVTPQAAQIEAMPLIEG